MGSCQSTDASSPEAAGVKRDLKVHQSVKPSPSVVKVSATSGAATQQAIRPPETIVSSVPITSNNGQGTKGYAPGYASGGSTPVDSRSLDGSVSGSKSLDGSLNGRDRANSTNNVKSLMHAGSVIGLDSMIEMRKEEGDLKSNMVHIEVPFGKPIEEVYDGVHAGPVLGSGISGLVRLVTHKATGIKYAVKCLDLGLVDSPEGLHQLREEILIMASLDHPNIVRLEEVYESHSEIYLVQELCLGGELFDRLDEQPDYHYTEAECARLVKQMLCAVRYLHSKGIIHRDMKLENFLFSSTSKDSELKMIDFGLSKHFKFGEIQTQAVGTPYTVAPEVIKGSYDERCDIWAIGVITYLLLSGDPPFGGCGGPEPLLTVRANILSGSFSFTPEEVWSIVSPQAKDFICKMLVTDPKQRPTAREAQTHTWLREWATRGKQQNDHRLNPNVVNALVSFKEFSDMRKLLCEVLSFTLLPDQITDLRKEFEKMDTDGSGEISLQALKEVLMANAGAGSLGALTEIEVEDIFNAMRVRKTETRIHWHEFIAAGLSQCQVDDRNLRLAFDRLDSDHKGYITFENVTDLMGGEAIQSEAAMKQMWGDSMKACNCHHARITYDDFLLLMKGQTREPTEQVSQLALQPLHVVHEINPADELMGGTSETSSAGRLGSSRGLGTPPITPLFNHGIITQMPEIDMPLSMDDDDDDDEIPTTSVAAASQIFKGMGEFTPPQSPQRGATDYCTVVSERSATNIGSEDIAGLGMPQFPKLTKPSPYVRKRSRSVDDRDTEEDQEDEEIPSFGADARRAMLLPEHEKDFVSIMDENKTALVVNRQLYRAHRQMRQAVLDATKRFEEQQTNRARVMLTRESEDGNEEVGGSGGAGLVLRHGHKKQLSSEAVRMWLKRSREEQEALVQKANKRGGRGKSRRKKTTSDMTGMLAGLSSDLNSTHEEKTSPPSPVSQRGESQYLTDRNQKLGASDGALDFGSKTVDLDAFPPLRDPTVPGVFRKTQDPFASGGRYGI